jgi:hypothetical protein
MSNPLHQNILKYSNLQGLIKDYIQHPPKKGCVGLIGAPGIGKTAGIESMADDLNKKLSYVACPLFTPGDVLGAAWEKNNKTVFLPTEALDEDAVIFFDELANADRSMQNIANRILLDGELNGRRFKQARFFASNPTSCSEMAEPIPNILVNKTNLYTVDYRWDDMISFITGPHRPNIHPIVAAFIAETKDQFLQVKDWTPLKHGGVATPEVGMPFPSPRAYCDLLSDALYRIDRGLTEITVFDAAYASIGAIAGKAFGDYAVTYKYLPRLSRILAGDYQDFPDSALQGGVALLPLQMMAMFGLLGAAENKAQFGHAVSWIFEQTNKGTLTKDLIRSFAAYCRQGVHKEYYRETLQGYAKKHMKDPKELVSFLKDIMETTAETAQF